MVGTNIVLGILAHVDAGKTTLTEALLYRTGAIRRLGRVDRKDSWFDSHELERKRGITIFSKQNPFELGGKNFTLIDTPGHVDFSAEMERTLSVLDYAVLVIDGVSGIQAHTETLNDLLSEYKIPTFIFINKTDREQCNTQKVLDSLKIRFDDFCIDFTDPSARTAQIEEVSMLSEEWMEDLLGGDESEETWKQRISSAVRDRRIFPCVCGSALTGDGVDRLMQVISDYCVYGDYAEEFSATVYKIMHDSKGNRLSFLKVTGGELSAKMQIGGEKTEQIRIFKGEKSESVQTVKAGGVCAVSGLYETYPGCMIGGGNAQSIRPKLCPMLVSQVESDCDINTTVAKLREIEDEMPELAVQTVSINGESRVQIRVMGRIQLEILKELVAERFGMNIEFGPCRILYKETVAAPVMGYGHYEPLRHYAEAHLRIEPAERNSGISVANECSLEMLDSNFRNLILSHIKEKTHLGILTGSPLTDVKITLTAGRSHLKHTEGGDFREATYRAIRQGLEKAENVLLEPYYGFVLRVPADCVGRAVADIQRLSGEFEAPEIILDEAVIKGEVPASEFLAYPEEVIAYTKGRGVVSFSDRGYRPCHNPQQVIEEIGYEKDRDLENPSSSVFCAHGGGFEVKWQDVDAMRHIK